MFVPSTIISGGMWALQHLHQSTFMDELQLIDRDTMNESFMYKLSQAKGFEYFKYVVLVGSTQDSYVPMHTAQATIPRPAEADKKGGGDAYMQMATNLMSPISQKTAESDKQTTVVRLRWSTSSRRRTSTPSSAAPPTSPTSTRPPPSS